MKRLVACLRLVLLLALVGIFGAGVHAREFKWQGGDSEVSTIAVAALPIEAQETLRAIHRGGPFPYPYKDGSIFGNFERRLPQQARGYYREFTVPTPGRRDRGARRIIAGSGPGNDVRTSGEYYYTPDHYRSFRRIRERSER